MSEAVLRPRHYLEPVLADLVTARELRRQAETTLSARDAVLNRAARKYALRARKQVAAWRVSRLMASASAQPLPIHHFNSPAGG